MHEQPSVDDVIDLYEPLIGQGVKELLQTFVGEALPEIVGELPYAKLLVSVGKVFNVTKDAHRARNMLSFLAALENGEKSMAAFDALDANEKEFIRGLVVSQLDMYTDSRQAEATALIVGAYLRKDINRLTLSGVLSEIKNTNPLLYYFDGGGVVIDNPWNSKRDVRIIGPSTLPAAFGATSGSTVGEGDVTLEYRFSLSTLGKTFFDYVYLPMQRRHSSYNNSKDVTPQA